MEKTTGAALPMLHSLPDQLHPGCGETLVRPAHPALRPYVLGYSGFRARLEGPLRRRVLPMNAVTVIVDFAGPGSWITGLRSVHSVHELAEWRHGVALGLTPAGVRTLLGVPLPELVGLTVGPEALLGRRAAELADRLASAPDWPTRFTLLDGLLMEWLRPGGQSDRRPAGQQPGDAVDRAWWRLQRPGRTVGGVAAGLGVSRRALELGFQRWIGMTPKTVARIARFQRAVHRLSRPGTALAEAIDCGYADQSHFSREVKAMAGFTPTELFAFVQDLRPPAG